jgi:sec-independent protein translocase protein TatB
MFDIGFWELVILFGLGLLVLGPERLPRVAMQIGNWAGQARRMARTLTTQLRDELDVDINQPFKHSTNAPRNKASTYNRPGVDDLKPGNKPPAESTDHSASNASAEPSSGPMAASSDESSTDNTT